MIKISFLRTVVVIALCFSTNLFAVPESNSESSQNASIVGIVASAVAGSAFIVAGEWVITKIKPAKNKVNVTMRSPAGKNTTLTFPAKQLAKTPLANGQKVQVEAVKTGYLFKTQGNTLGFLPNSKGKSLLHSDSYN